MSNAGCPGALAASAVDGAGLTCQRLCAALGIGVASARTASTKTPETAAAKVSRRDAVRSKAGAFPQGSIMTAPSSAHLTLSAAARRSPSVSAVVTRMSRRGSQPSSIRPGAYSRPYWRWPRSSRIHRMACPAARARSASIAANAAALPSPDSPAKTSCKPPRTSPPRNRSSIEAMPKETGLRFSDWGTQSLRHNAFTLWRLRPERIIVPILF